MKQNAVKWVLFVARWLRETTIIIIGVAKICRQNKSIWHFFLVHWTENFKHFCFHQYCLIWIGGEGLCDRGGHWYGRVVVTGVGPGCHADDSSWKCLDYLCWEQLSCNFQALMKQDIKPLMWYPVVYLATTIFPLIHRFVWKHKLRKPYKLTISQVYLPGVWSCEFQRLAFWNHFATRKEKQHEKSHILENAPQKTSGRLYSVCLPIVTRLLAGFSPILGRSSFVC